MNIFENLQIDGNPITRIRRPIRNEPNSLDGYVDATMMCKAAGKLWGHYWSNASTKAHVNVFASKIGIPIKDMVVSKRGGNDATQIGTWIHPTLAIHLAMWCSPEFAYAVIELVQRYERGDLTLIPELLANHDAAIEKETGVPSTTQAFVNTTLGSLRDERQKSIAATKECGQTIRALSMPAWFYAVKNNAVNQAAKGFTCTTAQFKKLSNIRPSESLRDYFCPQQQALVSVMEYAMQTKLSTSGAKDAVQSVEQLKEKIWALGQESGIHSLPLLTEPVRKQMKAIEPPHKKTKMLGA